MNWTLNNLPEDMREWITKSYHLKNKKLYRERMLARKSMSGTAGGLFAASPPKLIPATVKEDSVIWGTDNYSSMGKDFKFAKPIHDLSIIVPRVEKSKADQKARSKQKAEVFTPSWVCNLQNNLIDDEVLYKGAFNSVTQDNQKTWIPSDIVKFEGPKYTWLHYTLERRLEATCGEGPYLMSRYDATTGDEISVRDTDGRFQRIGILDRKLRVISENVSEEVWVKAALLALKATFGYEWQGDNLLLARLNFINTFSDYYIDFFSSEPSLELLSEVAKVASWNLWQMDGLKMIVPLSCTSECISCAKKINGGHDGVVSLIKFDDEVKTFEGLLPLDKFKPKKK